MKLMKLLHRRLTTLFNAAFFLLIFSGDAKTQEINKTVPGKRAKENFDFNWQFHKGDIAMKRSIKAGGQGGLTDVNIKVINTKDTTIDYTDVKSATVFYPKD